MIDFTGCKVLVNSYEGADFKRKIIYDGDVYMLKFGQKLESDEHKPLQASYTSTPVSSCRSPLEPCMPCAPIIHRVSRRVMGAAVIRRGGRCLWGVRGDEVPSSFLTWAYPIIPRLVKVI